MKFTPRRTLLLVLAAGLTAALTLAAIAATSAPNLDDTGTLAGSLAKIGDPAPDFELTEVDGKTKVKLSAYRGKTVVLEWFNPDCPFVVHAHGEGSLKTMAAEQTKKGIVWLAINSGAPGKQGNGVDRNRKAKQEYTLGHPVLLDEDGKVGQLYGARTTPHMFIVTAAGKLAYAGSIDNAPFGRVPEGRTLVNYVDAALSDLAAGREVKINETKPWGCSVKYAN